MTKFLLILLIPSILLGNTRSIFDDYLYNVDYLKNGNEESLENVRFIAKNITSGSLRFRQINGKKKYFHIEPKNIIRITDLQTNQVINDYYNLNKTIDKKSFNRTVFIGIPVSIVLFLGVAVLMIENAISDI
tara:strand:+ start:471 stop:866 length:396 start_codon:yes stop_codon:yes gene_type:complete